MASDYESMRDILPFLELIYQDFKKTGGRSHLHQKFDYAQSAFKSIIHALHNGNTLDYLCNKMESHFRCGSDDVPLKAIQFLKVLKAILDDDMIRFKPNDNILSMEEYCKNELGMFKVDVDMMEKVGSDVKSEYIKGREDLASEMLEMIEEERLKSQPKKEIEEEPPTKVTAKIRKKSTRLERSEESDPSRYIIGSSPSAEQVPPPPYMSFRTATQLVENPETSES